MAEDGRKIGEYKVTNALHMGDKEYALCENMDDPHGLYYMTCIVRSNDFYEFYDEVLSGDNYLQIAKLFADRIQTAIAEQIKEAEKHPVGLITADMCDGIRDKNLEGEIIVIRAEELHPEYRTEAHQIVLCTGGNGAKPNARGSAVFCESLTDCEKGRFDRVNVLGILKKECYPEWVSERAAVIREFEKNPAVFEYGSKHFLGVGQLPPPKERDLSRTLCYDPNIDFETRNGDKVQYNRADFLDAAGTSKCDVFRCYENGKLYVPTEHELFRYKGEYIALEKQQPKRIRSKTHDEPER